MSKIASFSTLLCSIFLCYLHTWKQYSDQLKELESEHDNLRKNLDTYAIEMGPKNKYLFEDVPLWGREQVTVENSRIGAANKKSKEWLDELKATFAAGGIRDQFDNILEYIKKKQYENYLKEHSIEQVEESVLKAFWTNVARTEINLKAIEKDLVERTDLMKFITLRIKDIHKWFGNEEGELLLTNGMYAELVRLSDELEAAKEEPKLFADFLKLLDAEVTAMNISFGRLKKISKNISKAQEATVTQAMEYSEGLKKVERLKNILISTRTEIIDKIHQPVVDIYNRVHSTGNELMSGADELGKFNHKWMKDEFDSLEKIIKPGSELVVDEMQNSEILTFRIAILKAHLERYERGLEGNRYQAVNEAVEVMRTVSQFVKDFEEFEARLSDDGKEWKDQLVKEHGELGYTIKQISKLGADLEWLKS